MLCGLAPMEGTTDFPTRLWFSQTSKPDFNCSPFVRVTESFPKPDFYEDKWPELGFAKNLTNYHFFPQFMASHVDHFLRAAEFVVEKTPLVELNCGCPSPTVVGHGAGSSVLKDPLDFGRRMERITNVLGPERLSVKMRTGFDDDKEFPSLFSQIKDLPLARLVLHGRTRLAKYTGKANWDLIEAAAKEVSFPVYGSGDIVSPLSLQETMKNFPSVKYAIVGRGALRNPWLFEALREGRDIQISKTAIKLSLGCFALLQLLDYQKFEGLRSLVEDGTFVGTCLTDKAAWRNLFDRLSLEYFGKKIQLDEIEAPTQTLGRTKMIWHSLRSSLQESAMMPTLLRSKSFKEFFEGLDRVLVDEETLVYKDQHDWLYNGGKNLHKTCLGN